MSDEFIPLSVPCIKGNEWKYLKECLDTGWVSSVGKYVDEFEAKFAQYTGAKHAVSTVNGTAAIHTALLSIGVGKGDYVIVPSLTFIASANPVLYCNAIPVFADSEKETWNIDPQKTVELVKNLIKEGKKPKAVIVVHLYGHPADIDPILNIAKEHDIFIIEDATEALGSKYKGKMCGTLGHIGCFSFNGNKLITTGGGGMLVTNDPNIASYAKYLSTQARNDSIEYVHNEVGYNYRLTNIQAALGIAQLEQVDDFIKSKRETARQYKSALDEIEGIKTSPEAEWAFSNFWMFSVLVDEAVYGMGREKLLVRLNQAKIQARPFFTPLHTLPPFKGCPAKDISNAVKIYEQGINLPCSVGLTADKIERIIGVLKKPL